MTAATGAGLRSLRRQRDLSLRELARRTGISAAHISLAERGQRGLSASSLARLATGLDVDPSRLLTVTVDDEHEREDIEDREARAAKIADLAAASNRRDSPLVDLLAAADCTRPAWRDDAACAGYPVDLFFPHGDRVTPDAAALCDGCPVRAECLREAVDADLHGVWAGTTRRERQALRRQAA